MSESCPECNNELIELYTVESQTSTTWFGTYDKHEFYGYWCPFCEKMYEKHHKEWFEPWKFQSIRKV